MPVKLKETPVVKGKVDTRPDSKHAKLRSLPLLRLRGLDRLILPKRNRE